MRTHTPSARILGPLAVALLTVTCRDSTGTGHDALPASEFAITTGARPAMDQFNGSLNESGMAIVKGFDPTNPRLGSTIIATFVWLGSANIITDVTDHIVDGTPVDNDYRLVEYVTDGGISMATYVATNVQNFPEDHPYGEQILVVRATLSEPITDGGVIIAAYEGVEPVFEQAVGAHRSASGTGSSMTTASAGAIAAQPGALMYAVTLSDGVTGIEGPPTYTNLSTLEDAFLKADAEYTVQAGADSTDPQWTWFFNSPSTWLASAIALNPAPGQDLILTGTLNEAGSTLGQGFHPRNPHRGDAIIATFFWLGSTNPIIEVTDRLSDGTPVGNTYHLVEHVTADGISMATYVATNVQNFPDPNPSDNEVLKVEATLSEPVTDGGVMLSAFTGVQPAFDQALGAHQSASGSGSDLTIADAGAIPVEAGALVYGVTLSNGVVGIDGPEGFANITTMSDAYLKSDGRYSIRTDAGDVDPQWSWHFNSPASWVATVLSLKAE